MSFLPPSLIDYIEAPFPYLVSISGEMWDTIYNKRWSQMDEDVVVLDTRDQGAIHSRSPLP